LLRRACRSELLPRSCGDPSRQLFALSCHLKSALRISGTLADSEVPRDVPIGRARPDCPTPSQSRHERHDRHPGNGLDRIAPDAWRPALSAGGQTRKCLIANSARFSSGNQPELMPRRMSSRIFPPETCPSENSSSIHPDRSRTQRVMRFPSTSWLSPLLCEHLSDKRRPSGHQ
jgi:hypothetical protein